MTSAFEKPERSCFNLVHYAMLIPECHSIFVMPPGCSRILRLSAIEEGISDRFTMFNLEPSDIIEGTVENILIDGAEATLRRLTQAGRRPKVFAVFVSCVDSFIGTDHTYVMDTLRSMAPDIQFLDLAVDPINRDTLPPLVRLHNAVTSLFERSGTDRSAIWLGHYLKPDENDPLYIRLTELGITSRHLSDCKTLEELKSCGNCTVNIVASPVALTAARSLKKKFGTPYFNKVNPNDPDSISEEELASI